jgi:hypothetical protein
VALCQARISTKPLWGFSSSNPYHSQSRAEQPGTTGGWVVWLVLIAYLVKVLGINLSRRKYLFPLVCIKSIKMASLAVRLSHHYTGSHPG